MLHSENWNLVSILFFKLYFQIENNIAKVAYIFAGEAVSAESVSSLRTLRADSVIRSCTSQAKRLASISAWSCSTDDYVKHKESREQWTNGPKHKEHNSNSITWLRIVPSKLISFTLSESRVGSNQSFFFNWKTSSYPNFSALEIMSAKKSFADNERSVEERSSEGYHKETIDRIKATKFSRALHT